MADIVLGTVDTVDMAGIADIGVGIAGIAAAGIDTEGKRVSAVSEEPMHLPIELAS
jgi:hypothetical protein